MVEKIEEKIDQKLKKGPAGLGLMIFIFLLVFCFGGAGGLVGGYYWAKNKNQDNPTPTVKTEVAGNQDEKKDNQKSQKDKSSEATYIVRDGDTLFSIGLKFNIPWTKVAEANGLSEDSVIKTGQVLKIPGVSSNTGKTFEINKEKLTKIQAQVDGGSLSWYLDPVEVAKEQVPTTYNISKDDEFSLKTKNNTEGVAIVEVVHETKVYQIKLIQPVKKGVSGIWTTQSVTSL